MVFCLWRHVALLPVLLALGLLGLGHPLIFNYFHIFFPHAFNVFIHLSAVNERFDILDVLILFPLLVDGPETLQGLGAANEGAVLGSPAEMIFKEKYYSSSNIKREIVYLVFSIAKCRRNRVTRRKLFFNKKPFLYPAFQSEFPNKLSHLWGTRVLVYFALFSRT